MQESITTDLFAALNIAVMEQIDDGYFSLIGTVPNWFKRFYPNADYQQDRFKLGDRFLFLENFLIDAENYWVGNEAEPLKSGLWSEIDSSSQECYLEASAVRLPAKKILLIELKITTYKEKQDILQKARKNILIYHKLVKEIKTKEILVHCIVHDIVGQITGINYCFELLALQKLTGKAREYLEIGKKQSYKQQILIREILDTFSAAAESVDVFEIDPQKAPDVLDCAKEVVNALLPAFSLNHTNLRLHPDINMSKDWKVVGEKSRMERVLTNLIENALRYSPLYSTVTVDIKEDGENVLITIDDEGAGVSQDVTNTLFQKFSQGKNNPGRSGLGLYFCRITVERWGGKIGYSNRAEGGAQFWFCLPVLV